LHGRMYKILEKVHAEYMKIERAVLTKIDHPFVVQLRYSFQAFAQLLQVPHDGAHDNTVTGDGFRIFGSWEAEIQEEPQETPVAPGQLTPVKISHFNAVLCDFGTAGPSDEEAKLFSFGYVDPKSMRIGNVLNVIKV
ncbi:hypothetical protein HAX54_023640, partial [Datura stramonium]|nr:hypothetical protein [Datura stramonium]